VQKCGRKWLNVAQNVIFDRKVEIERQGLTDTMNPVILLSKKAMEKYGSHNDGK